LDRNFFHKTKVYHYWCFIFLSLFKHKKAGAAIENRPEAKNQACEYNVQ